MAHGPEPGRSRAVVGLLLLASVTIITLDARHETSDSPVDPLRLAVASVVGPLEDGAASALRPITSIPDNFGDVRRLREDNEDLQAINDDLIEQLRAADANSARSSEVDSVARFADDSGFDIVPAQVIGMGAAQSFSRTVTIDAGTRQGVAPDLTVINSHGLVGRVISATPTTATVLLIIDPESTIGGRLGESMELGFLAGNGDITDNGTLELSLVDHTVSPEVGDTVLTWGSRNGAPYLPGVPVGDVVSVRSSPADLTETARVKPYADFSSLDMLAVVTNTDEIGDRSEVAAPSGGDR